jgi:hypothetical protein
MYFRKIWNKENLKTVFIFVLDLRRIYVDFFHPLW